MIKFLGSFIGWLAMVVCCFVGCFVGYDLGKKNDDFKVLSLTEQIREANALLCARNKQLKIIKEAYVDASKCKSHGISWPHTDTIHDTVVKIKRVYIEKESFKSDIPSTMLFKKE